MTATKLDEFTRAYVITALFTEHDNPVSGEFEPHGQWTIDNIDPESLQKMTEDCQRFQSANNEDIESDLHHAGRDFWYTRNGHGCGFWDGDWPEAIGRRLTASAESYGEQTLYLGDDGKLYV